MLFSLPRNMSYGHLYILVCILVYIHVCILVSVVEVESVVALVIIINQCCVYIVCYHSIVCLPYQSKYTLLSKPLYYRLNTLSFNILHQKFIQIKMLMTILYCVVSKVK